MSKQYNVGIYTRLSVDDATGKSSTNGYSPFENSTSIANQKELLSKFATLNGWYITKIYCDDSYSGGNFKRPAFIEMLEDVKTGVINLVLAKDLSRLGRDYVEVGRYTDYVFPSHGCRFIAVLDGIDTASDDNDMLHFRSLMNDYHLKDLSVKIKSVRHTRVKQGQYICGMPPYGYRKNETNKYQLVVDEYASQIIQTIYSMRGQGISYHKITQYLNLKKVLAPYAYWFSNNREGVCPKSDLWSTSRVKELLQAEVYTGTTVLNRSGTQSYKCLTLIAKPKDEWVRHENTHEAIVSREEWEKVQAINDVVRKKYPRQAIAKSLFNARLTCMDCNTNLVSNTDSKTRKDGTIKQKITYYCAKHMHSGCVVCSWHRVSQDVLCEVIIADVIKIADQIKHDETAMIQKLQYELLHDEETQYTQIAQEAKSLQRRLTELDQITGTLYEDKVNGIISTDTFTALLSNNQNEQSSKTERYNAE